jgi:OmcA/MtrC family decaheme c-type cytochrome
MTSISLGMVFSVFNRGHGHRTKVASSLVLVFSSYPIDKERKNMRLGTALGHLTFATVVFAAACSGSDGKDGKAGNSCTVIANSDGTETLLCGPDGGTATISNGKSCTVTAVDGGSRIACQDGTTSFVASGSNGTNGTNGTPGQSCNVVNNGDGTRTITCPGEDGGTISFNVRDALVNYATMSADNRAALDLKIVVSRVTVPASGQPLVAFKVVDGSGNGVKGLPPPDMRFALLKLVPASTKVASNPNLVGVNGSANDTWVSYMAANPTSTAGAETAGAAGASADAGTPTTGVLTDNGDGTYSYTFLKKVTDPVNAGTTYDPAATHRLTMILSETGNPFVPVNVVKDFVPATGQDVTGQAEKADGTACLECHSSFRAKAGGTGAFHGGARYDLRICVTCHNDQRRFTPIPGTGTTPAVDLDAPGVVDATTGAWTGNAVKLNGEAFINLPVFIHKLHMGDQLTLTGGAYTAVPAPYDITFPQDVDNCVKCHRTVAQANNFKNEPSRRVCGACHDDISFLSGAAIPAKRKPHSGGPMADDSNCTLCHPANAPQTKAGIGVLDAHMSIAAPDPQATWLGGSNANTNAGFIPAAGTLPTLVGAAQLSYAVKAVSRDANKNPSIVFQILNGGKPVVFNDPAAATEIMDGFVGSPSVYFAFALPQDGVAAPADFNATASGYIKTIWNGTATGTGAGTITFDAASGYYTITLTGATIPDSATMLTGGVGYTYSLSSAPPLTQINLPAYPYGDATVIPGCIAGKLCGGLIIPTPDVWMVATDAVSDKAYAARRVIVSNDKCKDCHAQLGANPSFHAGQRNDAPTCAFCHRPNQTSGGWSASSSTFIHSIHGAAERTVGFNWHAACPPGTTYPTSCTADNADPYFAKVTYPGILNNCQQCHLPGTYDFSSAASAAAVSRLLMSTVATGKLTADISTSPYVATDGTDYGNGFATSNQTASTYGTTTCSTTTPCVCSLAAPCEAAATTLVKSPIAAACSSCHDAPTAISHMKMMGASFYETRAVAATKTEQCMMCHGPGTVAAIALVHY